MNIFETAKKIILKVMINTGVEASEIFAIELKTASNIEKRNIISLASLFFRNYYFIEQIGEELFNDRSLKVIVPLGLVYLNLSYKNYVERAASLDFLNGELKKANFEFDEEKSKVFDDIIINRKAFKFKSLEDGGMQQASIIFNKPLWLTKMVLNQHGFKVGMRALKAMSLIPNQYAILNPIKEFDQINNHYLMEFEKFDDYYLYNEKININRSKLIRENYFLELQLPLIKLVNSLPKLVNKEISFFTSYHSNVAFKFFGKYYKNNNLNYFSGNLENNYKAFESIKKSNLGRYFYHESSEKGLISHLTFKQDLIFYMPESTNFEMFRKNSEKAITFNQKNIDKFINVQETGLDELSLYIDKGGILVYCVETLNLKESNLLIVNFLTKHSNFEIVKEETNFPYEDENGILYYAILRKTND